MRIFSGTLKGRSIESPKNRGIRPTSDRSRQAIFNILCQGTSGDLIRDKSFLDICAGTGALGFEAFSRGANRAGMIDKDLRLARYNAQNLGIEKSIEFYEYDLENLSLCKSPFDIIFCDPPYGQDLLTVIVKNIIEKNWCHPETIFITEMHFKDSVPPQLKIFDERSYGKAKIIFSKL